MLQIVKLSAIFLCAVASGFFLDFVSGVNRLTTSTGRKCECTCEPSSQILDSVERFPDLARFSEGSMLGPGLDAHLLPSKGRSRSRLTSQQFSYSATRSHHHHRKSTSGNSPSEPGLPSGPPDVTRFDRIFPPGADREENLIPEKNIDEVGVFIPKPMTSSSKFDGSDGQRPDKDAEWLTSPTGLNTAGYSTHQGFRPMAQSSLALLKQDPRHFRLNSQQDNVGIMETGVKSRARLSVCHLKYGQFDDYPCKMYCELKGQAYGKCSGTGVCECGVLEG